MSPYEGRAWASTSASSSPPEPSKAPHAAPSPAAVTTSDAQSLVQTYCVSCHSQRMKTGGLVLEGLNAGDVKAHPEVWEKVVRKLGAGLMPPAGSPRPDRAVTNDFRAW